MDRSEALPRVTTRMKVVSLLVSLAISGTTAEGIVRWRDHGAYPRLRLFAADARSGIVLEENAAGRVVSGTRVWSVTTRGDGVRGETGVSDAWIAVGDSQVLGFGVEDGETFSARVTAAGAPMANAGVPGYGVEDALRHAGALLERHRARGVVLVVNEANDWDEAGRPIESRYRAVGGWLVTKAAADDVSVRFLGSVATRSHLLYYAVQPLRPADGAETRSPGWLAHPGTQSGSTRAIAAAIGRFERTHSVPLVVCFLPVDAATSERRARVSPFGPRLHGAQPWRDTSLRDGLRGLLGARLVDLTPSLSDPASFLDGDYHLSARGHAAVAMRLLRELRRGGRL